MQIFYFTRTGHCENVAHEIAQSYNKTAHKIDDGKDWGGKINFVKAGAAAAKREVLPVTHDSIQNDDIIVVFPIWAGTLPPAIRGFLQNISANNIIAVTLSGTSSLKAAEKELFSKVYEVKGKPMVAPKEVLLK
ncbi:MAG: hypothetical protein BEN19_06785 [Epulopiscium sp. Nuni2H_MBin003]|nr:MAG: hypothetical protein BEN19_06785 [Epulopiscium sp. Nuni2H_MBin003]